MDRDEVVELTQEFSQLSADLLIRGEPVTALRRLAELAVKHVSGCAWAVVTREQRGRSVVVASSDDAASTARSGDPESGHSLTFVPVEGLGVRLTLHADGTHAFDPGATADATLFGLQSAGLVALTEALAREAHAQTALISNRDIGVAIGILMSEHQISRVAAFTLLRETSQRTHVKLRDVAADLLQNRPPDAVHPREKGTPCDTVDL